MNKMNRMLLGILSILFILSNFGFLDLVAGLALVRPDGVSDVRCAAG